MTQFTFKRREHTHTLTHRSRSVFEPVGKVITSDAINTPRDLLWPAEREREADRQMG